MKPAVLTQRSGIQLSYAVPNLVYSSHVYPQTSSNGSTVIIYGHEAGLRLVWHAGKKFKSHAAEAPKVNGRSKDEPEVIDLGDSDDEPEHTQPSTNVEFEEDDQEIDPSEPYPSVLRLLDIPLGAAALHIAISETPTQHLDHDRYPSVLRDRAVIAAACSDLTLRLIVCPLTPPAPGTSDLASLGVQILQLPTTKFHQDFVTGLAITFTAEQEDYVDDQAQQEPDTQQQQWSFLVASTSCTGRGLLLIHQVPINGTRLLTQKEHLRPLRRISPRVPLASARLDFNTSPYPAERHSTLLITAPDASCVKIYQVFAQPLLGRTRRDSVGTIDSASSRGSWYNASSQNGKMLISLRPEFCPLLNPDQTERQKKVLGSKWIYGGRAIITLLEDGEFGIWDLEACGPASNTSSKNPIKGQANISGIVGGSLTSFAVNGRFHADDTAKAAKTTTTSSGLVPSTPHTRKVRAEGLFRGSGDDNASTHPKTRTSHSSGSIRFVPTAENPNNESLILNYNSQNIYIPSVQAFWQAAATTGKGTLKTAFNGPVTLLPTINTAAETIQDVALLPSTPNQQSMGLFSARQIPNFLISTSTRLILFTQPHSSPSPASNNELSRALQIRHAEPSLLQSTEFDIDTMDRILDGMAASAPQLQLTAGKAKPNFGKSVAFARDEDGDISMDSPSPAKFGFGTLGTSRGKTERRLFS